MQRLLSALALLSALSFSVPLAAQQTVDCTNSRMATPIAYTDAEYSAKKKHIPEREVNSADNTGSIALRLNESLTSPFIDYGITTYMGPADFLTSGDVTKMYTKIKPASKQRAWMFYAPATGNYVLKVRVPGPGHTTVELYSTQPDGAPSGASHIAYSNVYEAQGKDVNFTIPNLPKGVCGLRITANSGNVVGWLPDSGGSIFLDQQTYASWTIPNIPISHFDDDVAPHLPTIGSTYQMTLNYPAYPTNTQSLTVLSSGVFDGIGTVRLTDPHFDVIPSTLPAPVAITSTIHLYGPPTLAQLAQMLGKYYIYLDFEEVLALRWHIPLKRRVVFTVKRIDDYVSHHFALAIDHMVPMDPGI